MSDRCAGLPRSWWARRLRAAEIALLSLALVTLAYSLAFAHATLERAQPAPGAHVAEAPRVLRLTFTEAPVLQFTRLQLLDPDSTRVTLGPLRLDSARTVSADIEAPLLVGTYTVVWQIAGADGHPVRGRYRFTIVPGATGLASAPGSTGRDSAAPSTGPAPSAGHHDPVSMPEGAGFGAESPLYVAIRWLQYATLLTVVGVVSFRWAVLGMLSRRAPVGRTTSVVERSSVRSAALGVTAAVVLVAVGVARLLAQSYALHAPADALDLDMIASVLARTVWGWGWLLQVGGALIALGGLLAARHGRDGGWAAAAFGALALAFSPALSGHAASTPRFTALAILSDGLHVLGAAGWLGSLLVTISVGVSSALALGDEERGAAVADLINAYSPTALAFAGLVAVTGLVAGWLHLGTLAALWQSAYGRTLLVKLAILSVVAGTGAYNWRRVRPRLGDAEGARRIRRSATMELAVGALVLLVTAILVATPTPMDATTSAP